MSDILRKGLVPRGGMLHGDGDKAAATTIPFGVGVQLHTVAGTVKPYVGGTFWGISVRDETIVVKDGSGNVVVASYYPTGHAVSVLRKGPIVVEVEEAVDVGDLVYCDTTTGNFWGSAGAGRTLIPGLQFTTAALADGDLAEVDVNLPA